MWASPMASPTAVRDPLSKRARGDLDPVVPVLGVSGRHAVPLAEILDLGKGQFISRQVQERVEKHGAVPAGKNEAVAVGPMRVSRVEAQMPSPQDVRHGRRTKRKAGMARFCLFDGIDGEHAYGVDAKCIDWIHFDDLLLGLASDFNPCAAAPRRAAFGFVMT